MHVGRRHKAEPGQGDGSINRHGRPIRSGVHSTHAHVQGKQSSTVPCQGPTPRRHPHSTERRTGIDVTAIRVVQVGNDPSIAYCATQFALWGAQVFVLGLPDESEGDLITARYLSTNKHRIRHPNQASGADVVLTALRIDECLDLGLELGNAIVSRVVPTADDGVWHGKPFPPLLVEAASGYLSINGSPDREPVRAPGNLVAYVAGASAFGATLAALHKRLARGVVDRVVTRQLDVLASITPFLRSQYAGRADARHGGPATGVRLFPVADGYVSLMLFDDRTFAMALHVLGIAPDAVPHHLDSPEKRRDVDALGEFLRTTSAGVDAETFFRRMFAAGVPRIGLFLRPDELLDNAHMRAIGYFRTLDDPVLGRVAYPGMPATLGRSKPPPLKPLEVARGTWPFPGITRAAVRDQPVGDGRPLSGVRIVDFTQAWIGPFATTMLADLGAEVIKVESHKRPDVWRNPRAASVSSPSSAANAHPFNLSANFNSTNRNKRDIAIDLNDERGVAVARELVRTADIVTSNFTPRVMRKFGLDYASLAAIKDDIICVSWSGYGQTGPYADFKANGATIEAMAGWDALFGYRDGGPMVMGFYQMDAMTGLQMAACTLLALIHRDQTGEGQEVAGSMIAAAVPYIGEEVIKASMGRPNVRWGNRHPDMVPHGVYPVQGDDRWVALACPTDGDWRRLAPVIGVDPKGFASLAERRDAEELIEARIAAWSTTRTRSAAVAELEAAGVPVAPVLDVLEILDHPEFANRDWFPRQCHPDAGEHRYGGFPWCFEHAELVAHRPPPRLGEHTREILLELGFSRLRIDALFDDDVVGTVVTS